MKRKKRKKFRAGQIVRSIYDAQRTFRIDMSIQPERLFHEDGSDSWYTRTELLTLGEANERPAKVGVATFGAIGKMRSLAFRGISGWQLAGASSVRVAEKRKCLECETGTLAGCGKILRRS